MIEAALGNTHEFEWVKYTTRIITEEGRNRFVSFLTNIDWEQLMGDSICPDINTDRLHNKITSLNDICFPLKTRKIRSSDKPWINDNIRRKIKKRKREFFKNNMKRTERWSEIKKETTKAIKKNKLEYYKRESEKLMTPGSNSIPFKAL